MREKDTLNIWCGSIFFFPHYSAQYLVLVIKHFLSRSFRQPTVVNISTDPSRCHGSYLPTELVAEQADHELGEFR